MYKMPQCKAKYCTIKRGQGKHTFAIPDPLKNKTLCSKWIHNLGIEQLNIKTFKYSSSNIVCEDHFEEDCFEVNMQAKVMGYTPRYKKLKPDAVPTIFKDTVKVKIREYSIKRKMKADKKEVLDTLLAQTEYNPTDVSCSKNIEHSLRPTTAGISHSRKRKSLKTKLQFKETSTPLEMVDKSIQVSPAMDSQSTQCSIRIDEPSLYCPNCYIRQRGDMATTDHSYIRKQKKIKD